MSGLYRLVIAAEFLANAYEILHENLNRNISTIISYVYPRGQTHFGL